MYRGIFSFGNINDAVVILIDINRIDDTIAVTIQDSIFPIVKIDNKRLCSVAIRRQIVVGISQRKTILRDIFIVCIIAIVGVRSLEDIQQAIMIGVGRIRNGRGPIITLGDIQLTIVVGVTIEVVCRGVPIGIDRRQPLAGRSGGIAGVLVVGVIESVLVDIGARRFYIILGRLRLDVIGDAIVVAVDILVIADTITIGIL
ncbi:hypothetical protein KUV74_15970 [Halomonas sp. DP1Y21-3]|uniref:hypothetical protein n=1 Tax=Halomonas sp. DP1Y21-3 TaxID=2859080 RepID=UPI001C967A95|nr:hypothetical protein [Halomonas sp. DP1Y21-3]MBY6111891.1 hypothetical protein [Halomonas sp. DP1Y21-3]